MPLGQATGPKLLKWYRSEMRNDLALGELAIALCSFRRSALQAGVPQPGAKMLSDGEL